MKQIRYLMFIILLLPLGLMANERVIELNITGQPPLNVDGHFGFMGEVVNEAFRRIGYKLITIRLPAERGLVNANRGVVDGEMSRVKGIDQIYKNLMRVPEKIMNWEFVGFSYDDVPLESGWKDLSSKNVSHINGWKIYEKNIPSSANITKTKDAESLFNLLAKNRTDIVLYERWGGHYLIHEMKLSGVTMSAPPLAVKEMYVYLHKKHKSIVPLLAKALAEIKTDGTYARLFNKHLMPLKSHERLEHLKH